MVVHGYHKVVKKMRVGGALIPLYPHQKALNDEGRQKIKNGCRSILFVSPTGSGKTYCISDFAYNAHNKGNVMFITVPRRQLLSQMADTLRKFKIPFSYIAAGKPYNPYAKIYLCSAQTLINRLDKTPAPRVLAIDEAHFGSNTLDKIINHSKAKGAIVIGYSASPTRTDGKGLGKWYDDMALAPDIKWLIDKGYLSDYRLFAPYTPDLSGIKTTAGDYNKGQLAEFMEKERVLIGNAVNHYRRHVMGRLNLVFCTSIKHSKITAQSFCDAGIPAAHVDGETPENEMNAILRDYAARRILVLTSCNLLCFGFDLALASKTDVNVECMSDLAPTQSEAKQLQKWGRVLRKKDYPAIILDHAGNVTRHGLPCDSREWALEDKQKKTKNTSSQSGPRVIQCITDANGPGCFFCYSYGNACPECGKPRAIKEKKIEEVEGELAELDRKKEIKTKKMEQGQARTLEDLIALGRARNYKNPTLWASKIISSRMQKR